MKVDNYFLSWWDLGMGRTAFTVASNDILAWHWQSWCATGQQLGGILHPDYSHSPVASMAISEQEPGGTRTKEAGSAVAVAGLESSPGGGLGNDAYVLILCTLFCDIFRLLLCEMTYFGQLVTSAKGQYLALTFQGQKHMFLLRQVSIT